MSRNNYRIDGDTIITSSNISMIPIIGALVVLALIMAFVFLGNPLFLLMAFLCSGIIVWFVNKSTAIWNPKKGFVSDGE